MRNKLAAALIIAGVLTLGTAGVALAAGVKVVDNDFQPGSISVAAGETVTFTNSGGSPHTATADDGSFDTGTIQPGSSATVTFDKAGKYPFFCRFHGGPGGSGMSGVITVTGAAGGNTGGGSGGTAGGTAGGSAGGTTGGTAGGTGASTGGALPQTATPLPLIAAAGALLLGAGLWLGLRRRA
ncbi:MAG TPA: cupredoxin domain-containing protein [Actinomycetota bacterium]